MREITGDIIDEILTKAKQLQKECHSIVAKVVLSQKKDTKITTQDGTNVFMFKKLAELELRIEKLENQK